MQPDRKLEPLTDASDAGSVKDVSPVQPDRKLEPLTDARSPLSPESVTVSIFFAP